MMDVGRQAPSEMKRSEIELAVLEICKGNTICPD